MCCFEWFDWCDGICDFDYCDLNCWRYLDFFLVGVDCGWFCGDDNYCCGGWNIELFFVEFFFYLGLNLGYCVVFIIYCFMYFLYLWGFVRGGIGDIMVEFVGLYYWVYLIWFLFNVLVNICVVGICVFDVFGCVGFCVIVVMLVLLCCICLLVV